MGKKLTGGKIFGAIMNSINVILLALFILSITFTWGWDTYFIAVALGLISIWNLSQGGWKLIKSMKFPRKNIFNSWIHMFSFAFGILGLYLAITILPIVGNILVIPIISGMSAWIIGILMVLTGFEIFV